MQDVYHQPMKTIRRSTVWSTSPRLRLKEVFSETRIPLQFYVATIPGSLYLKRLRADPQALQFLLFGRQSFPLTVFVRRTSFAVRLPWAYFFAWRLRKLQHGQASDFLLHGRWHRRLLLWKASPDEAASAEHDAQFDTGVRYVELHLCNRNAEHRLGPPTTGSPVGALTSHDRTLMRGSSAHVCLSFLPSCCFNVFVGLYRQMVCNVYSAPVHAKACWY